jgi:hypothetical protein
MYARDFKMAFGPPTMLSLALVGLVTRTHGINGIPWKPFFCFVLEASQWHYVDIERAGMDVMGGLLQGPKTMLIEPNWFIIQGHHFLHIFISCKT